MSTILAAAALCLSPQVHDGDTIRCNGERIRLAGIDAPELPGSDRCSPARRRALAGSRNPSWCDYPRGKASRDALASFLSRGQISISRLGTDRYGRTLARVSVNGRDAGSYLIAQGLARRWQ